MDNGSKMVVDNTGKLRRITRYIVAVTSSILLVVILIEGYKFYTLSPGKLYNENYAVYELDPKQPEGDSLSPIRRAYREKKYAEVINLNRHSVLSIQDVFLTGMAYLETDDFSSAISSFQVVIAELKEGKPALRDAAEHYLALAYLQNRDYDQAIELMSTINDDPSHLYATKYSNRYINKVKRLKWR